MQELIRKHLSGGWLRDLGAVVFLFLLAVFVFRTDLMEGRIYYEADTSTYYYPVMSAVDRAIDRSSIPLWTRDIFGGYPLFADGEGGALYPPNVLLLWLLPIQQAFLLLRVVRFFFAGAFLYAFCRTLGIGRSGSLLGALAFAYGSFMVGQLQHANLSNGAVWLPLVLMFVELSLRASGRKRFLHLLLAGVSLAMQSLAVHIQPVILTLLALSLYVAFRTVVWRGIDAWISRDDFALVHRFLLTCKEACLEVPRAAVTLALVVAVGFGLAAVQLIPLYELGQASARGTGPTYWFATLYALPVLNVVTLILPYFFVAPGSYQWSLWSVYESTVYAGVAPLMLAVLALFFVRRRTVAFLGFLAVLTLFLAFGDYPSVKIYSLVWELPGFHFLRAPARFLFLFTFSVAVLAAMGIDWLARTRGTRDGKLDRNVTVKVALFASAVILFGAALLSGFLVLQGMLLSHGSASLEFIQQQYLTLRNWNWGLNAESVYKALLHSLDIENPGTSRAFILVFLSAFLLLLWLRFRSRTRLWTLLLICVSLVDLVFFAAEFHPRTNLSSLSTPSGVTKFLVENNGLHRVYSKGYVRAAEPNRLMAWRVAVVGGYSSLSPTRNIDFNRVIERGNLRLLDLWNVRYIVSHVSESMPPEYPVVFAEGDNVIYENPHTLPRAFLVGSAVVTPNGQAAMSEVAESSFDPSNTVVLEEGFDLSWLTAEGMAASTGQGVSGRQLGEVQMLEYERESVLINTSSTESAFLILADSYYPGWKAYVDGREAKIYRADYLFRAVFLTAGPHEVVFTFEPSSFYIGRTISLVTLFLVLAALVVSATSWSPVPWRRTNLAPRPALMGASSSAASVNTPGTEY